MSSLPHFTPQSQSDRPLQNGLDGISIEAVNATRAALECQLRDAEESLRLTQTAIVNARHQEVWALLQALRAWEADRGIVQSSANVDDAVKHGHLLRIENLEEQRLLGELAAARDKAYHCRRAITELNRAIAVLSTVNF